MQWMFGDLVSAFMISQRLLSLDLDVLIRSCRIFMSHQTVILGAGSIMILRMLLHYMKMMTDKCLA